MAIEHNELNRTIEGALESLWVKLIERNEYATGLELYNAIIASGKSDVAFLLHDWVTDHRFDWHHMVGDWK